MRLAIVSAAVLALAGTATAATTRKVPQDYANIQAAEDACVTGDTILVAKGRYILDAVINVDVQSITIVGQSAIIDGARPNLNDNTVDGFNVTATGVTITGFTFRNGENGVYVDAANCTIAKCTFIDQDDDAIYCNSGDGLRVESCKFLGCYTGVEAYSANTRIMKNTIRATDDYGLYVSGNGARLESNNVTYIEDSDAIYIGGNNAVVLKNKVYNTDSYGIDISGNGATVTSNQLKKIGSTGIYVSGTDALVDKNKASLTEGFIEVYGNNAKVLSNACVDFTTDDGFEIQADNITVSGNKVSLGSDDADGYSLYSNSATGTGTIENNKVNDVMDSGFYLGSTLYNCTVRNCSATNCGSEDEAGFWISGNGNTFENLKAVNVDNMGFRLSGDNNDFTKCVAVNVFADGFRVLAGSDANTFTDCSATNCGGEGFDNRGTNTELTGGKYRGDRNDVANDTTGGATITLTGVDKVTPGTPQSQVD